MTRTAPAKRASTEARVAAPGTGRGNVGQAPLRGPLERALANRAVVIAGPAALVVMGFIALFAALALGGGAQSLGVEDPGSFVRYGQPAAQMLVDLGAAGSLGSLVLAAFALSPATAGWNRLLDVAAASSALWTVAAVGAGIFEFVYDTDVQPSQSIFGSQLLLYLTDIAAGQAWLETALLAATVTVLCVAVRSHFGVAVVTVFAAGSLIPMAQQGHAASQTGDHDAAITALGLHIIFAAVWLGGLAALTLIGRGMSRELLAKVVSRYSTIAIICFVVVAASGVVSAGIRLGSIGALLSAYGLLVIVKSVTLLLMGGMGALHRTIVIRRLPTAASRRPFWILIGAELLLMGVASGFAAALSHTPTPVQAVTADTTPAELLTGSALPPAPGFIQYLTDWHFDLLWVLLCAFLLFFYIAGVVRLHRRGDRWPISRTLLWSIGIVVLFFLTNGGLNEYEKFLFSAHMLLHMMLAMVVPILLVPAAPVTLAMRAIAKRTDGTRGGREWLLLVVHSRIAGVFANPVVAGALFAGSLLVFYYTPLFSWATTDHIGHEWMTTHFLITGYLFVQSLIGVDPLPHRWPYPLRLMVLLATMAFHAFFGLSLLNGQGLLLANWYGAMGWGTSALADQHTGGGIAWSVGEIPTVMLALIVAVTWARSDERDAKRLDRAEERSGNVDLNAYNDMLAKLNRPS